MEKSDPVQRMRCYIQLVATGPELSKSLTREQAADGLEQVLLGNIDPIRSAIFLIALRMKRETEAENLGALDALQRHLVQATATVSDVLVIADPFNGYLRSLPATPFLPAVTAACGLPTIGHGMRMAGPKYGLTINRVLQAAGKSVNRTPEQAAAAVDNDSVGWSYVDQQQYHPLLHDLVGLRESMVKRCLISTLEVVLNPVRGSARSHLMTGFVHKAYPPVYEQLARHAGFDSAAIVRGVEGGCVPSLSQLSRYFSYRGDSSLGLHKLDPAEVSIVQKDRSVAVPEAQQGAMESTGWDSTEVLDPVAVHVAASGREALGNRPGAMRDSLIYSTAIALSHAGLVDSLAGGASRAREALKDGTALARFEAG